MLGSFKELLLLLNAFILCFQNIYFFVQYLSKLFSTVLINASFVPVGWFNIDDNKNTNVYVSGWYC